MPTGWTHRLASPLLCLLMTGSALAADPLRAPLTMRDALQDKNFYFLSALENTPAVHAALRSDATLARIAAAKRAALEKAPEACAAEVACYARSLSWSDTEIDEVRGALAALGRNSELNRFVEQVLRPSGMLQRYAAAPTADLLASGWQDAAGKLNRAIEIFALGVRPRPAGPGPAAGAGPRPGSEGPPGAPGAPAPPSRVPGMQMTTYDVKTPEFARMVQVMAAVVASQARAEDLFFAPTLKFAVELLRLHSRDEAGRLEPLEGGENRAALQRIKTTRWEQYPYTVIVVLGSGPERDGVALSPVGRLRLILAAREFKEKKAPFLLVSGGYVHPALTPYCEALEMKKALQAEFGIPAEAIIIDPQARRTTTNLRNAARLMYRYGIPFERKGLILTDQLHSATVESPAFADRCRRDFGYMPVKLGSRTSPFDLEFTALPDSLHADASDLLDP